MMDEAAAYTLVVPTYNRPEMLARLLRHLAAHRVRFPVRILDSSRPEVRAANAALIAGLDLHCLHAEYPEDMHPFDKFREGVHSVQTPLCGLCADDDMLLIDGLRASIDFLQDNPDYSVAHGCYFQFSFTPGQFLITTITYEAPDYDMPEPISRLQALMRHYQALTYGTYRTAVLARIFDAVRPVTSILARELLSSALAVVHGKVARLPVLSHGRNLDPSSGYVNWHPLEWAIRDPVGLFSEYMLYRRLLLKEVLAVSGEGQDAVQAGRLVDLIHLQYLVRHAPDEVFDHIIQETFENADPAAIFASMPVTLALQRAADEYKRTVPEPVPEEPEEEPAPEEAEPEEPEEEAPVEELPEPEPPPPVHLTLSQRLNRLAWLLRTGGRRDRRPEPPPPPEPEPEPEPPPPEPEPEPEPDPEPALPPGYVARDEGDRRYLLAPAFLAAAEELDLGLEGEGMDRLVEQIDSYR